MPPIWPVRSSVRSGMFIRQFVKPTEGQVHLSLALSSSSFVPRPRPRLSFLLRPPKDRTTNRGRGRGTTTRTKRRNEYICPSHLRMRASQRGTDLLVCRFQELSSSKDADRARHRNDG